MLKELKNKLFNSGNQLLQKHKRKIQLFVILLILSSFTVYAGFSSFKIGGNQLTGAAVTDLDAQLSQEPEVQESNERNQLTQEEIDALYPTPITPEQPTPRPRRRGGGGGGGGAPIVVDPGIY